MIKELVIDNFKSIKHLEIPCKKLNIFIGEPNSGKSNIIEALALQSQNAVGSSLNKDMFRYKTVGDLFYDFNINEPISVNTGEKQTLLTYEYHTNGSIENQFKFTLDNKTDSDDPCRIGHDGKVNVSGNLGKTNVRYYEYKRLSSFSNSYLPHLAVPFGENLPGLYWQILIIRNGSRSILQDFLQN